MTGQCVQVKKDGLVILYVWEDLKDEWDKRKCNRTAC